MKALTKAAAIAGGTLLGAAILSASAYVPMSHLAEKQISEMQPNSVIVDMLIKHPDNSVIKYSSEYKGRGDVVIESTPTHPKPYFSSDEVKGFTTLVTFLAGMSGGLLGELSAFGYVKNKE